MTGRSPRTATPSDRADPTRIAQSLIALLPGQVPTTPQSLQLIRALRAPAQHIPPFERTNADQPPTRKDHDQP